MPKITPFLWFDTEAEEAARFYTAVFKSSKMGGLTHYGDGRVLTASFELEGTPFTALNGGPMYKFTEAVSFFVSCETQEEVDHYWEVLSEGGRTDQCGWLKDRFGLSWQIIPTALPRLLGDPDRAKANRVLNAMMAMKKLDIAALEKAGEAA